MDTLPENYMQVLDELYLKACSTHKLVAVGEIGLDYHYEGYDKERQIKLFDKQVEYAVKKSLPVIVHCREATQDCLDVLNKYAPSGVSLLFRLGRDRRDGAWAWYVHRVYRCACF